MGGGDEVVDTGAGWTADAPGNPAAGSVEFLRSILAAADDLIIAATPDGRFLYLNRFAPGFGPAHLEGRTIYDFVDDASRPAMRACIAEVLRTRQPGAYDTSSPGLDGGVTHYHTRVAPVVRDGEVVAVTLVARDVTRARESAQALAESEQRLRFAVAATGMGLWTWDPDADAIEWDDRMRAIFGVAPGAEPRTLREYVALVHPDDRADLGARTVAALGGAFRPGEYRVVRPDGEVRWVRGQGGHVPGSRRITGGLLDVTERRAVEERLRVAQRAEAVGRLVAGFAHNFNNLLSTILPNVDLAARRPQDAARYLEVAKHGAERAAEIVRQLLVFAGQQPAARRAPLPLGRLVARTLDVVRGSLGPAVAVELRREDGADPVVLGDPSLLEQVFLNLLMNARDAVGETTAPRIAVTVDVVAEGAARRARAQVLDNGAGMDAATRARIFEPFFTTKASGQGTGLGLASALAIVRDHGGELSCESTPGAGSAFTVLLPVAPAGAAVDPGPARGPPRRAGAAGGAGRVLLVDDDRAVRETTAELLRAGGHDVDTAATGAQGVARFEAAPPGHYRVVLVDLSMPDLSGQAVCRAIRARAPGQRVLFFSGLAVDDRGEADGVILKPVDLDALLARIAGAPEPDAP